MAAHSTTSVDLDAESVPCNRSQADTQPIDMPQMRVAPGERLPCSDIRLDGRAACSIDTEVFLAHDRGSNRPLAVKILRRGASQIARECLRRELQLMQRLDSPHVARVVAAGVVNGTQSWFAMERPSDRSLRAELTEQRDGLGLRRTLELFASAARSVAVLHRHGIVHRDLKPSNMLLVAHGTHESVALIDFGIACEAGRRLPFLSGTPCYMPPEQGEGAAAGFEADVYSLGACAYEMLTGHRLRRTASFEGMSVERPAWTGSEPCPLRALLERCLHPDPDRRYPDAEVLAQALERVQTGTHASPRPPRRCA